jgi:hypothetical protein
MTLVEGAIMSKVLSSRKLCLLNSMLVIGLFLVKTPALQGQQFLSVTNKETAARLYTALERFVNKQDKKLGWAFFAQRKTIC